MRIRRLVPALLALLLCLTACAGGPAEPDQSGFTWKVEVLEARWSDGLETVKQSTQYDGTVIETGYEKAPEPGQVFLLAELRVYKDEAGGPAFSWADVAAEAESGEACARLSDSFLSDYGCDRLPGGDLRLMENRGWVCFQVPEGLREEHWTLVHRSGEGENRVPLL